MAKNPVGGVQGHSVGDYYPLIVVGFGSGKWRVELGKLHSHEVDSSAAAVAVARRGYARLREGAALNSDLFKEEPQLYNVQVRGQVVSLSVWPSYESYSCTLPTTQLAYAFADLLRG